MVKRYSLLRKITSRGDYREIGESESGNYVLHSDYSALESENRELREAVNFIVKFVDPEKDVYIDSTIIDYIANAKKLLQDKK